ncbi:MAG TPA: AAA family ATPase [Candidatus Limnocylindria bacterium]|nr:AAA family ATPase [Candidatus Limnocylindria bacterium]
MATPMEVMGRQAEQATVAAFLERASPAPAGLVLYGPAGIGKTILWREAVMAAEQRGWRVLIVRGAEAEAALPFAGLISLLDPVADVVLSSLPPALSAALAVAMRRAAPTESEPDPLIVSVATLAAIRLLGQAPNPLLVAIDDLQWLDASTRRLLEFVARRLRSEPVTWLATVRSGQHDSAGQLVSALSESRTELIELGPLPLAALAELLRRRLGAMFRRPTLLRIQRASAGNPFFALELGRALLRRGITVAPDVLPVPEDIAALLRDRLAALSPIAADAVLVTTVLANPTRAGVVAVLGGGAAATDGVQEAIQAAILERDGESIRFTHPLLASVAYDDAPDGKRRMIHGLVAQRATDAEERARHLARSSTRPNERIARELERAARSARNRGSAEGAAELAELSLRSTPIGRQDEARRRGILAAKYLLQAGDAEQARSILEPLARQLSGGQPRAEVLVALADTYRGADWDTATRLLNEAAAHAGESLTRIAVERRLATAAYMTLSDRRAGREHARRALELAEAAGDNAELAASLVQLAWLDWSVDSVVRHDLLDRAAALHARLPATTFESLINARGLIMLFSGDIDGARQEFLATRAVAERVGDSYALAHALLELITVETRGGNWPLALDWARQAEATAHLIGHRLLEAGVFVRKANVLAHLGSADDARRAGEAGLHLSRQVGATSEEAYAQEVIGFLELSLGDAEAAERRLGTVVERYRAAGSEARFDANHFEALVSLGKLAEAERALQPFEARARQQERPWWMAVSAHCRGLLMAAGGDVAGARRMLNRALALHERVDVPFDRARTLLALGEVERRDRRRGASRRSIGAALAEFERLGARLWAERARRSLARGGPQRGVGSSETDQRIIELVARGNTNREIAATLFMSPHTVDTHLRRIYRAFGVRSRAELARHASAGKASTGSEVDLDR